MSALLRTWMWLFILFFLYLGSCQKEINFNASSSGNNSNGSNNNNGNSGSCDNSKLKLKRWQSLLNADYYITAEWNTNGTIKSVKVNVPSSEYRTASYVYENNRISEAILLDDQTGNVYDTALFHYNAAGHVDSMYLKNDVWYDVKLDYANGKLVKYTRWAGPGSARGVLFYWIIETDAQGNITKATERRNDGTGTFLLEYIYEFSQDDRKNPLTDLAPYLFYLDNANNIFKYWGPNNYSNQHFTDLTGNGVDTRTGFKYKYNNNCYPAFSQTTVNGVVLSNDPDFSYEYY